MDSIQREARRVLLAIQDLEGEPPSEKIKIIEQSLKDEREKCADIADRMRIKYGSPVLGPYENGNWDQGKRIANLIRNPVEF